MKSIIKYIGFIGLSSAILMACEDLIDPQIKEVEYNRVFTPLDLTARIRNMVTVELSWNHRKDADAYVVEISEDSGFGSIIRTLEITPEDIPVSIPLDGETMYYARVKGTREGVNDSKWASVSFETAAEQIFEPLEDGDVQARSVVLRWPVNSAVTHFLIAPGNIQRDITEQEKANGEATVTGLSGETEYTVKLLNGNRQRGSVIFTTLIDLDGAIAVYPEDDLNAVITAAQPGDVLALFPGDYLEYKGTITINKSISIKGLYPHDRPIVYVQFDMTEGAQNVEISNLEMNGEATLLNAFQFATSSSNYNSFVVGDCIIRDYKRALLSATGMASSIESVVFRNCIVTNVLTDGGDFIDVRVGLIDNLILKNNTFNNCAPARDFIRLDNSSANFPGRTSKVEIDHCTFYKVSNGNNRRYLYVRFVENTLTVTNSIFAETAGIFTNQALSSQPSCSRNNYFNAPGFYTDGYVTNVKLDVSGNYTTLDPGFVDAENGNFTVTNQTLIDNTAGDSRWRP
jgi:hypothetical protein